METSDEEFVSEEETDEGPQALKRLRDKLKKAVEEKQEYLEGWQRARADFANYKREEASIHGDKEARVKAEFVESLLPALDSFEMALRHNPTDELKLVHKQLLQSLKELGVEQFGSVGDDFSPHIHEALAQNHSGDTIASVERSGYKIGNNIIRPAQVII
jgi:molecular chaperone GrpE